MLPFVAAHAIAARGSRVRASASRGEATARAGSVRAVEPLGVSVVVPSHDRPHRLLALLDALAAQSLSATRWELIVVHDYGRDDLTPLEADADAESRRIDWSRPKGWFLTRGFKIRVLHCWLTFESMEEASAVLGRAFDREESEQEAEATAC